MKRWLRLGLALACAGPSAAFAGDDPPKKEAAKQVKVLPLTTKTAAPKQDAKTSADDAPAGSPLAQVRAVENEFNDATQAFMKEYSVAKTNDERQKLVTEKYPQPVKYAPRMLKIAQDHPDDPAAIEAYVWLLMRTRGAEAEKAIDALITHADHPKVADAAPMLQYSGGPKAVALLRAIIEKNPSRDAQGIACLTLARRLASDSPGVDPKRAAAESEALFERVVKDYADVKTGTRSIAEQAKSELFEARNLSVGKPAPDIVGKDLADKPLKLSDYRGKIVMLDFWGDW